MNAETRTLIVKTFENFHGVGVAKVDKVLSSLFDAGEITLDEICGIWHTYGLTGEAF